MQNSGQWIFLRRGLVTCNNKTIPLALLLRNSMSHYKYGILEESHQQSWRGDAKKIYRNYRSLLMYWMQNIIDECYLTYEKE